MDKSAVRNAAIFYCVWGGWAFTIPFLLAGFKICQVKTFETGLWFQSYVLFTLLTLTTMGITFAALCYTASTESGVMGGVFATWSAVTGVPMALVLAQMTRDKCCNKDTATAPADTSVNRMTRRLTSIGSSMETAGLAFDGTVTAAYVSLLPAVYFLMCLVALPILDRPTSSDITEFYYGESANKTLILVDFHKSAYTYLLFGGFFFAASFIFSRGVSKLSSYLPHASFGLGSICIINVGITMVCINLYAFPDSDDGLAHKELHNTQGLATSLTIGVLGILMGLVLPYFHLAPGIKDIPADGKPDDRKS